MITLTGQPSDIKHYKKSSTFLTIPDIIDITNPLKKIGIGYFSYMEFDAKNKTIMALLNNDKVAKYFIQNEGLQRETSCYTHQSGELFSLRNSLKANKDVIRYYNQRFEIENSLDTLGIIEHKSHIIKSYCFGVSDLSLFRREYLEYFKCYFLEQASKLIKQADRVKISPILFSEFKNKTSIDIELNAFLEDEDFYNYRICYIAKKFSLSRRELQCLDLILHNQLNKQAAYGLNLSPRTIEAYINNLKKKIGCRTKIELILKILNFNCSTKSYFSSPK